MHSVIKFFADVLATIIVIAPFLCYRFAAAVFGPRRAFPGWSQLFAIFPGLTGIYLRRSFYRLILPTCASDVCVCFGTVLSHATAELGDKVYVGVGCMLGDVTLERDVLIGSHVSIINGQRQHGITSLDIPVREQPGEYPKIVIAEDTWIGDRAIVMANVGRHCVVGAGAVVTKPVPDFAIVVGNPARIQGFRGSQNGSTTTDEAVADHCNVSPSSTQNAIVD